MAYNLSTIRDRVMIDKLDDEDFEPEVLDNFINDTQNEIFSRYELSFMQKIFKGTIPVGATMFSLPSDVGIVQQQTLTDVDNKTTQFLAEPMSWKDFVARFPVPEVEEAGTPGCWCMYGGKILLDRPTDRAYTLTIYYVKKADALRDDQDVPEIPEEFGEVLVLGAYKRALERNEDFDLAAQIDTQYNNKLGDMISRYSGQNDSIYGQAKSSQLPTRRAGRRRWL